MCLAQGHNAVTLVRLEPAAPQSRVCNNVKMPIVACSVIFHASVDVCCLFFSKNSFRNTIRKSNSLDSDQDRHFVGPDLGTNCLQRLSADEKKRH